MSQRFVGLEGTPRGQRVAGVDEAGRGPLAGPVVAAAVILDPGAPVPGLADSKTLSASRREHLAEQICARATAWSLAFCERDEIDALNILGATMLAMSRAVIGLHCQPHRVLIDGNRCPGLTVPAEAVVGGDRRFECIAAASILAKVARDARMHEMHGLYPEYGFDRHKGYPTAEHMRLLRYHGPCVQHRRSFAPVKRAAEQPA